MAIDPETLHIGVPELQAMARQAGLLYDGQPIHPDELEFAYLVIQECARIADRYWDGEACAGHHIRAVLLP